MNITLKGNEKRPYRRYFQLAGLTVQVASDIPMTESTFQPKFRCFETDGPGNETISIRHRFFMPPLYLEDFGKMIYSKAPWLIFRNGANWRYLSVSGPNLEVFTRSSSALQSFILNSRLDEQLSLDRRLHPANENRCQLMALANHAHTRINVYHSNATAFRKGNLHSLSLFTTDQILLTRTLADRNGCFLHSGAVVLNGNGLLFVGHSGAGKSTIVAMLKENAEILGDDRMIVRRWEDGFRIHGTWSHGDVPEVSPASAPLEGIFFLEKASTNRIDTLTDKKQVVGKLLACLIKSFAVADWWEKMLTLVGQVVREVPCYTLYFDKSGAVRDRIRDLVQDGGIRNRE